jgi:hypothetical protein
VVATPAMVIELQEELLIREREQASWENAIITTENNLVAAECALGTEHMECYVRHDRAAAV